MTEVLSGITAKLLCLCLYCQVRLFPQDKLPIQYSAKIDRAKGTWTGTAIIPVDYFPPRVGKINAHAIHGSGVNRVYESLYPAPADAKTPDL